MIDPAGIPQITGDMDALVQHATALRSAGQTFASTGSRVHAAWRGLSGIYVAPEAEQLFAVTSPVAQVSDRVGTAVEAVAAALQRYAEEVRPIQQRLCELQAQGRQLVTEIDGYARAGHTRTAIVDSGSAHAPLAARQEPSTDWHDDKGLVERDQQLNAQVAQAVAEWMDAQRRCANTINSVYGGTTYVPDDGDGHHRPDEFGYSAEQLGSGATPWGSPEKANPDAFDLFADFGHTALDLLGMVPVVGEAADGLNAAWYGAEGDTPNAALSAAGAVPFLGWGATAAKAGIKGGRATGETRQFVTTSRGTTFDIPPGWKSRPADNNKGIVFQRPGADRTADSIRIMEPTPDYPAGYFRFYSDKGQPLDVNGKPGSQAETHIPENYTGQIKGWPQ